ncbi:MAG: DJ-1/PfpI family protein [Clostridia bacterium]|nr:DJ-1/PfpI family protein [Clostridia bacterium]
MVYMFLANGFEEIEALYTLDVLRRAMVDIKTVGVSSKTALGSHGIPVICDITTDELPFDNGFDMIILPGGMPGSTNLDNDESVNRYISIAKENGKYICAICAAPFILGKRGLLKGKKATCFPGFEKYLDGATVVDAGVVRDGNIITGRAMGSAHDFALAILEALKGEDKAQEIKKAIILK